MNAYDRGCIELYMRQAEFSHRLMRYYADKAALPQHPAHAMINRQRAADEQLMSARLTRDLRRWLGIEP